MGKKDRERKQRQQEAKARTSSAANPSLTLVPSPTAQSRHVRLARQLTSTGFTFRQVKSASERAAAIFLIQNSIPESGSYQPGPKVALLVALDLTQAVAGVAACELTIWNGGSGLQLTVEHLAVDANRQGQGIGTVLLGMVDQLIPDNTKRAASKLVVLGGCAVSARSFYQKAGFRVLPEHAKLPFPFGGGGGNVVNTNTQYPCWFAKTV
ncbi:GNAT family N-acetyltransferase [Pseudarthrobacter sp. AL07]|uniref:GNAT family N-acetyltransferase n=1 Tax=unclassified Pseudarthrobacter TaxID=2647000 RepID=UPI00249AFC85|nr:MULTISPECIES: GNAT family N-acetyltransferase [unclassified Pseudarthrobacter]MDI3195426.1 GNAT family N-acetyltransferase [Pseudarthrobacter sp. AL20]MDI3209492.1 GNAT family N-acetyltransferase [Pseudarthrobacter sp. AL07]